MTQELPKVASPVPFKRFAEPVLGKMLQPGKIGPNDKLVPYMKAGHVQWSGLEIPEDLPLMWASPSDVAGLQPSKGDLLVCEGGEVGRAALVQEALPEETIIQNSLHLVREGALAYPPYLKYAIEHIAASGWLDLVCNKATIAHLTVDKLRALPIPYWTRPDQTRIANFLDEKTARIDALIAEKERLVEKLEEHWASVVLEELGTSEAGGRIGWTNIPLKYVTVERCDGPFGSALTSAHYVDEGARVIRLQNIRFGEFDSTDAAYIDDDYFTRELTYHSVLEGDVLIAGLGDEKNFVGRACVAPNLGSNALVKADCFRFRVDTKRVLPKFVALQLSATARRDGGLLSSGSTRQRIPLTVTECRLLCLPTLAEQIDIVERLERRKREHSTLLHHTAEHINLLLEYRSSLISAAVTGKLEIAPKVFTQK